MASCLMVQTFSFARWKVFWKMDNVLFPPLQLDRASALFETIRHEAQLSTDYKLSLFDLQTSSYQALQRVLVSLGESELWGFYPERAPRV